jgi:hypothetical protein
MTKRQINHALSQYFSALFIHVLGNLVKALYFVRITGMEEKATASKERLG